MTTDRYIAIDEEGYFTFDGNRVDDEGYGRELLTNVRASKDHRFQTTLNGQDAWIEAFDAPFLARHVRLKDTRTGVLDLAYGATAEFTFDTLSTDEWDRFHGQTTKDIPFVLSRQAQVEMFDLLDEFDDDSITVRGIRYAVEPWLKPFDDASQGLFWTKIYQTEKPGWELGREAPALPEVLPQLKLSKCRVLVLGCGSGHDAAFFARAGHVVTAVDFSSEAIQRAKAQYGELENIKFVQSDVFQLPDEWAGNFDIIFEHTCYCAITPDRRNELVQVWRKMLAPNGHLLGVFFSFEKREGPPFGGSEWEIRERLKKYFNFLFWTRWHRSLEGRKSRELVLFARKKDLS